MVEMDKLNELIGKKTWIASSDVYKGMARPRIEMTCREWRGFHVENNGGIYPIYHDMAYDCKHGTKVGEAVKYRDVMLMYSSAFHGVEHCLDCLRHEQRADTDIGHWVCASRENREEAIAKCLELWKAAMDRKNVAE